LNGQQLISSYTNPFSGAVGAITPVWNPAFIDVFIEGYYVPDSTLSLWTGGKK
jgi:hypothetical protein